MNQYPPYYARPLSWAKVLSDESHIADQFQGFEVEFDDKATLFPVQVEKEDPARSRRVRELRR